MAFKQGLIDRKEGFLTGPKVSGRKRKLNPLGETFLNLYLNPRIQAEDLCQQMKISPATYYRYLQELTVPVVRLAFGNTAEQTLKNAITKPLLWSQQRDLKIIQNLGRELGVRFKIIPSNLPENDLREKNVDIAIGGFCWTQSRAKDFYHSDPYEHQHRPHGILVKRKNTPSLVLNRKPILAVTRHSVHSEFAWKHLPNDFLIREFVTGATTLRALTSRQADRALIHSSLLPLSNEIEATGSRYNYDTFTTLLFHRDSMDLITPINRALSKIFELNRRSDGTDQDSSPS